MDGKKCILVSVNMGYGHQRAIYPLLELGGGKQYIFGEQEFVSGWGKTIWKTLQKSYNFFSSAEKIPVIGKILLGFLERFEQITPYYPVRDLSAPTMQTKALSKLVKSKLGRDSFTCFCEKNLPILSSFYTSAMAAERHTEHEVYCLICDADIHRIWVADDPSGSRINYLVPCNSARRRLREYGVPDERIFITGFPLPKENIGDDNMEILKADMAARMARLNSTGLYPYNYHETNTASETVDLANTVANTVKNTVANTKAVTITFAVGGAGAQKEFAEDIINSLKPMLKSGRYKLNLIAGIRDEVYKYFQKLISKANMSENGNINIIYEDNLPDYFKVFNENLRTTDILWTKPSELSFYCGLGIPIIMAPTIGAQEDGNRKWLQAIGAAVDQEEPAYCGEWITDMIEDGVMARIAMNGYMNAPKNGVKNIAKILFDSP